MSKMTTRADHDGVFIVLEGIDGAGTTTQAKELASWFEARGRDVFTTREPSDGPIGQVLREMLRGSGRKRSLSGESEPADPTTLALLFAADRLDHLSHEILPHLEADHVVICDRYVLSSLAYQSVEVDLGFVKEINKRALTPDVTIFLDVEAEVAMARVVKRSEGRDSFENLPFQQKVAANYRELLKSYHDGRVVVVDGGASMEEVTETVREALEGLL